MSLKISVVIPTLNQGKYIEQTLQSIIDQQYQNTEILVIDGGSSDNTVEIIKKFNHKITYWVSEPDKGQSDAICKGLQKATGDILCWINSDDYYMPGAFERISDFFNLHTEKPTVLTGHSKFIQDNGGIVWEPKSSNVTDVQPLELTSEKLLYCWNYSLSQPSTFWNRKTIEQVGLPNVGLRFTMDLDFWIKMLQHNTRFYFTPTVLSCFRYHSESKTMNLKTVQRTELFQLGEKYLSADKSRKYHRALKLYFESKQFFIQADRLSRSNRKESFKLLRTGIKNMPVSVFAYFRLVCKVLLKYLAPLKKPAY
jgi:glycosyltransferase involved in cell wall biosynthesis